MASISMPDLLTYVYVLVDDWYQARGSTYLKGKPGAKPEFSDSEVITLMVSMEFIPDPAETQFIEHIRSNYGSLFPRLLTQSQFNRRARALRLLVELFRRHLLVWLGATRELDFLLDTKPIPVVGYKRSKAHRTRGRWAASCATSCGGTWKPSASSAPTRTRRARSTRATS